MKRCPWMNTIAGAAMSMAALTLAPAFALADVPPAMDRVPTDAAVVISMKNVGQFYSSINTVAKSLKLPMEAMDGLSKAGDMLKMEGLNGDGSAAVAIMSLDENAGEPPVVMVIPVKDFAVWSKALGGGGAGIQELTIEGEPAFAKDIGGGFAALSPNRGLVEGFAGKGGNSKAHESLMGPVGRAIAESNSSFIVANMQTLAPKIREGYQKAKEQMDDARAMMGGGGGANPLAAADEVMESFLRDATSGVIGFNASEAGIKFEFGSQFKEGSEFASYFGAKGSASSLISTLPTQPFLFSVAFDSSSPGLRTLMKKFVAQAEKADGGMMAGLNPLAMMEKFDGMAFSMGASPALMGGMFLNTTAYVKTSDPAGYVKSVKEIFTGLNGKSVEGVTYQTTFESGGGKVGGKAVDTWGMRMQIDPNNPAAQQLGQMQMMLFGPTGLSGYIAQTDGGVVMTYAKNSDLMTKALDAAKAKNGLNSDAGVKSVSDQFPAGRSFEAYIGVHSILETALGFAGMMGAAPPDFQLPDNLPPIGISGTTADGGVRMTAFMPTKVMLTIKSLAEQMGGGMGGGGDEEMPPPGEKAGQPKF